jgi:hypothetical protein
MSFNNKILTSLFGRRVGLQRMSTAESGGSRGTQEYLVGPEALRPNVSTAETTSTNLHPFGVSHVRGTSADSSSVFTLDPPIPGVEKTLYFPSTGNTACYVKTANSETIHTTLGSSHTTIKSTIGGMCRLVGVTTAIWAALDITSGTSSQAGGFTVSTST